MFILYGIFLMSGIVLLVFAALPHGKGFIPLHPVFGRLSGLFLVLAGLFKFFNVVLHRTISTDLTFVIFASLGVLFLLIGLLGYKIPRV